MLMLVRGSESCADIEHLRTQGDLFGWKPYDSTLHRTSHEISPATRDQVAEAFAQVRPELWRRSGATDGKARVLLDIDASLVKIHSENREEAASTFKGRTAFSASAKARRVRPVKIPL
jgi:hypothetical protein